MASPGRGSVTIALTQRMFETSEAPQVHHDIRVAARDAIA